jgi:hypothetical protein
LICSTFLAEESSTAAHWERCRCAARKLSRAPTWSQLHPELRVAARSVVIPSLSTNIKVSSFKNPPIYTCEDKHTCRAAPQELDLSTGSPSLLRSW